MEVSRNKENAFLSKRVYEQTIYIGVRGASDKAPFFSHTENAFLSKCMYEQTIYLGVRVASNKASCLNYETNEDSIFES